MYAVGKLLIDNCTFGENVAGDDSGGIVNVTGWSAAVLLNRVALHNNTGRRGFVSSEGGAMYSTQPGLSFFDDYASEIRLLTPAGSEEVGLFLDFADYRLEATVEVRRSQSVRPKYMLAAFTYLLFIYGLFKCYPSVIYTTNGQTSRLSRALYYRPRRYLVYVAFSV